MNQERVNCIEVKDINEGYEILATVNSDKDKEYGLYKGKTIEDACMHFTERYPELTLKEVMDLLETIEETSFTRQFYVMYIEDLDEYGIFYFIDPDVIVVETDEEDDLEIFDTHITFCREVEDNVFKDVSWGYDIEALFSYIDWKRKKIKRD